MPKTKTQESTQSIEYPDWYNTANQDLIKQAQDFFSQPFESYGGDMTAGLTDQHMQAFDALRGLGDSGQSVIDAALSFFNNGMTPYDGQLSTGLSQGQEGAAQDLIDLRGSAQAGDDLQMARDAISDSMGVYGSDERVVDEDGRLGAISDYMNPYQSGVVDPAVRAIEEAAQRRRMALDAQSTHSGSMYDSGWGVNQGIVDEEMMQTIGDTVGRLNYEGYNTAMGLRNSDLGRWMTGAGGGLNAAGSAINLAGAGEGIAQNRINQGLNVGGVQQQTDQNALDRNYGEFLRGEEDAYNRLAAFMGASGAGQGMELDRIASLLGGGNIEQQTEQNRLSADYGEFNAGREDQYSKLAALMASIGATNPESTTTLTEPRENFPFMQLLGAFLGAI